MKNKQTPITVDIVFYVKRTGHEDSCFDRYPSWLTNWLKTNKKNIGFNCDADNLPDLYLYNDSEELVHKFRLGDCLALTSEGVKCGFEAIFHILKNAAILSTADSDTSSVIASENVIDQALSDV